MSSVAANLGLQSGGSGFERTPDAQANLNSTNPVSQMSTADDADFNPRSPKRRRLSPPSDDGVFDIGAAAARALALSLGGEVPNLSTVSDTLQTSQAPSRQDTPVQPMASLPIKPTRQARLENLPGLRDLASKILLFLARLNHLEIGEMLFGPPSTRAQEYRLLKQKFDDGKRLYLVGSSPFLAAQLLELDDAEHVDMLRRINLAIFMASIFSGEIGLRIMDINFIDVFVPEGGRLLKAQGSIYLELKTHAFMAATRTASTMLNQVMMDLFPSDMEKFLIQKRPGAKGLAPSEQDFLNRLGSRRDILYSVIRSNTLNTLPDTYRWNDFAREVSLYLTKFIGDEGHGVKDLADVFSESATDSAVSRNLSERQEMLKSLTSLDTSDQTQNSYASSSQTAINFELPFDIQAMVAHAARTAALTMGDSIDMTLLPPTVDNALTADPPSTNMELNALEVTEPQISPATVDKSPSDVKTSLQCLPEATEYVPSSNGTATDQESSEIPHSSQTAPTQVLYERARQVNTNKALALKKAALPTHRRPWTTEEENALMTGLDEVKGPHWSQILAMYGPGGTVNESLKDRNQVQLKDKARNLKLFFLKAGIEVPYYLQAVTGDLKTRAPGQAEKMERERMMGEVERSLTDDFQSSGDFSDVQDSEHIRSIGVAQSGEDATDEKDQHSGIAGTTDIGLEFDMEAMIAQAAASASRGLGPPA